MKSGEKVTSEETTYRVDYYSSIYSTWLKSFSTKSLEEAIRNYEHFIAQGLQSRIVKVTTKTSVWEMPDKTIKK